MKHVFLPLRTASYTACWIFKPELVLAMCVKHVSTTCSLCVSQSGSVGATVPINNKEIPQLKLNNINSSICSFPQTEKKRF